MLRDDVWRQANPAGDGMLCIGCVEKRLGRRLLPDDFPDDFTDAHVNRASWTSARLRSRVLVEAAEAPRADDPDDEDW